MRSYVRSEHHAGEWRLSLWADSLEELFAEGARVVSRECGPVRGPPGEWERVSMSARDTKALLADWLNELLGRSEVSQRAYGEVRGLRVEDAHLETEVRGRSVEVWRSPLKAATYHGLELERRGKRWRAVVLFDV
jgi:SHS2 domain-containing protein